MTTFPFRSACRLVSAGLLIPATLLAADVPARKSPAEVAATVKLQMDGALDPCVDFYAYACGNWLKTTQLPADRSRWGRGFTEIAERNLALQRQILDELKAGSATSDAAKVGAFYGSCLNEAAIDAAGIKPLQPMLDVIATVKDPGSLMSALGKLSTFGVPGFFGGATVPDFKRPTMNVLFVFQGGIGLPDRDYYLESGMAAQKTAYQAHVAKMLALAGSDGATAQADAATIVALETELARAMSPREELRDPNKTYNKLDRTGLQALTPSLPWDKLFTALGHPTVTEINVATPEYFKALDAIVKQTSAKSMQSYLRWQALRSSSAGLSKPFVDESFEFYGKTLAGQREQQPRWKRCIQATDGALGEILGKLYVERAFPGESKAVALEMIHRVEQAFIAGLPDQGWMDDATRTAAKQKAEMIANKIGYPDKWIDYSAVKIVPNDYFANRLAIERFNLDRELRKVGQPVDKTEWGMTPPTVNASYNPLNNEMSFPAGIMQAPFFDRDFSAAMNYGAMGMVMGHELTHGFDDEGRKFAGDGQLREWWPAEVASNYEDRAQCVRALYSQYEVQPDLVLNGDYTSGENIADMGGIKIAYRAYKQLLAEKPEAATVKVEGLTDDQLFFVAYAQSWCSIQTPQIEKQLVTIDPHSHPRWRVNGPLSQFATFAEAFACRPNTPMNPNARCEVW